MCALLLPMLGAHPCRVQGRNLVCSQRWVRLQNFPFPDYFPHTNFHFGTPKQISVISKSDSKKRKKKKVLLTFITFPFHFKLPLHFPFPPCLALIPFLLFPLSLLFFFLSPFLLKFSPKTFQGWVTHPHLVTPQVGSFVLSTPLPEYMYSRHFKRTIKAWDDIIVVGLCLYIFLKINTFLWLIFMITYRLESFFFFWEVFFWKDFPEKKKWVLPRLYRA